MLYLHVTAGLLAIACGFIALFAAKGQRLHRKSGTVFAYAMFAMAGAGGLVALTRWQTLNIVAAGLVLYLVVTGWLTVLRDTPARRAIRFAALAAAVMLAVGGLAWGLEARSEGKSWATMLFIFGGVAALGAVGDLRVLARGIEGYQRIARHLWRMGLAMSIATMAFFLGQAKVFPDALRIPALLAIPVVLVVLVMLYWLGRVLITRTAVRA